jgi:hypothetical protein
MTTNEFPTLLFSREFDDLEEYDATSRGCLDAKVQQQDGRTYPVTFYDCTRLVQDLEYEVSAGRMCIADPGMIVLPEVTLQNMLTAVRALTREGYFEHLRPLVEAPDTDGAR